MKKRDFLIKSGILAAGSMIIPACGTKKTSESTSLEENLPTTKEPVREIGIQIYTVRKELESDLEGTIKKISDLGYSYLEVFGYKERSFFGRPVDEFLSIVKSNGLRIVSGHYQTGLINEYMGSMADGWDYSIEDAVKMEHEYMVCAYLQPEERKTLDDYKNLVDLINRSGEKCKNAGIQFCYHNHAFEFEELEGVLPMDYLLENTDPDILKVELDLYWVNKAGFDAVEFFKKYKGRVPLWHVKDMADTEEKSFTEVGNGTIDFTTIFKNEDVSGMKYFFVEQDSSDNALLSIEKSYNYLTGNLLSS